MRVCIPTTTPAGMDARLSPHFGKAPYFTLVDVEADQTSLLTNTHAGDEDARCYAALALSAWAVDTVVCQGMGATARETLRDLGLEVLNTEAWTVAEVVRELRDRRPPKRHLQG